MSTFVKPTPAEVADYCKERGKGIDPEEWYDHYEANGWKVGKVPMKNWQAAVRTWERMSFQQTGSSDGAAEKFRKRMATRDPALVHTDKLRAEFEASLRKREAS